MFSLIGTVIKWGVIVLGVIVLANWIKLDGRTVSDQVKHRMAKAQNSEIVKSATKLAEQNHDTILASERAKLKDLIRELNSPKQVSNSKK